MTKVKICGLTRPQDVVAACEANAWALGFICVPSSRRVVTLTALRELTQVARQQAGHAQPVGVFADAPRELIEEFVNSAQLDVVQLHGHESPEFCEAIRKLRTGDGKPLQVWKALRLAPGSENLAHNLETVLRFSGCDQIVLETKTAAGDLGGTGTYNLLTGDIEFRNTLSNRPVVLAGGLTPLNVAKAIRSFRPFAVDVASGVESAVGIKSSERLEQFFSAVREIDRDLEKDAPV